MNEPKLRDRLLATVGGMEQFESSFNWRTFSPRKRAEEALNGALQDIDDGLAALSAAGATDELAEEWLAGYVRRWAKYQHAGARTANPMVTGPARFPADRNRKRMEVEYKRSCELSDYASGADAWVRRRLRAMERRELTQSDQGGHEEREVGGVRLVKNTTLDRVQLIFPGKPTDEERAMLKREAFRWAPSVGAWQRQLTRNGVSAAERVLAKLAAENVSELMANPNYVGSYHHY